MLAMRLRTICPLMAAAALAAPSAASADFAHTVLPGESLSSVAAADGLTVSQLAAANGLPADAPLLLGSTVMIPPQSGAASSLGTTAIGVSGSSATAAGDGDAD